MKKYRIICVSLTTILICIVISYIGIRVFKRIDSKNKVRQEIISKLTEEELSNVNVNELVEDITGGIKYAKKTEKKENSVEDIIDLLEKNVKYEGNGYTIIYNCGGECISYSYYCGDKEVYSTFVLVPFGTIEDSFKEFIKENKREIVCGIFITILIIADIIYFIKYKQGRKQV